MKPRPLYKVSSRPRESTSLFSLRLRSTPTTMSRAQVAFLVILAVVMTTGGLAVGGEDLPQEYYNSRLVNSVGNRRLGRLFQRFLEDAETSLERPEKRVPCLLSGVTGPLCDYDDMKDARKEHVWLEENSPGKRLVGV